MPHAPTTGPHCECTHMSSFLLQHGWRSATMRKSLSILFIIYRREGDK